MLKSAFLSAAASIRVRRDRNKEVNRFHSLELVQVHRRTSGESWVGESMEKRRWRRRQGMPKSASLIAADSSRVRRNQIDEGNRFHPSELVQIQ